MSSDATRDRHGAGEQAAAARSTTAPSGESVLTRSSLRGSIMTNSSLRGSILTGGLWRDSGASARARAASVRGASATRPSDERARQVLAEARRRADELLGPSPTLPGTRPRDTAPRPPQPPAGDPRSGYATGAPAAYTAATESNSAPARTAITPNASSPDVSAQTRRRAFRPLAYIGPLIALILIIGGIATNEPDSPVDPDDSSVSSLVEELPDGSEYEELSLGETFYGSRFDVTPEAPMLVENVRAEGGPMVLVPVRIASSTDEETSVPLEMRLVTPDGAVGAIDMAVSEEGDVIDSDAIILPGWSEKRIGLTFAFEEQPDLERLEIQLRIDRGIVTVFR